MKIVKLESKAKIQRKSSPLLSEGMLVSDSQRESQLQ